MKLIAPSYYEDFSCIADKCKHSCCIGWEIDIDERTDAFYKTVGGELGKRLENNIDRSGEVPHFKLACGERCPFLNKNGLCDIISELGEGALCQICDDHPRYRNFYADRTEIGLGLCCEAAAELILNSEEKAQLVVLQDGGEEAIETDEEFFFSMREKIFSIIQNRTVGINERIEKLLSELDLTMPEKTLSEWADDFLTLEMLDGEWGIMLNKIKSKNTMPEFTDEIAAEQILYYFIYRHLADGLYDGRFSERVKFAILALTMIFAAADACDLPITEAARFYSSEIEYSEENVEAVLNMLL